MLHEFGRYEWQVLAREPQRMLIITEDIIALRWYHDRFEPVTWAGSAARHFLNGAFFDSFSADEKRAICPVTNANADNPWFGTRGGEPTDDRIFLLSLEEVCTLLGDSRAPLFNKRSRRWQIDDESNALRQASFDGTAHWWRLRSPGYYDRTAASVSASGAVYVRGNGVYGRPKDGGGLRPALWLRI